MDLLKLRATLGLDSSNYTKGLNDAAGKASSFGSKIRSAFGFGAVMEVGRRAINAVTGSMGGFLSGMDQMNTAWKGFESNMRAADYSDSEIEKAKAEMQDFASKSQFYSSKMASTYAQLASVGTKATGDLVKGLGGIAAASSSPQQAMDSLSLQATQMAAKPIAMWSDFQVMLQHSPSGMAEVAHQMGMSLDELVGKIQDKQVTTEELFNAIGKIGSNSNNELMQAATTYKSVGEAASGVVGYLQARLAPAFDVFSQKAISSITGIFDVIANIDKNGGLTNWVTKLLNSDSIGAAFDMIAVTIQEKMPTVMNTILSGIENLLGQIASAAPSFVTIAGNLIVGFANGIASHVPTLIAKGLELVQSLATGIINNIPQLLVAGLNLVQGLIKGIGDNIGKLPAIALRLVVALAKGIWNNKGKIVSAAFRLVMAIPKAIVNAVGTFITTGAKLIKSLWNGAKDKLSGLPSKVYTYIKKIPEKVGEAVSAMIEAGANLLQGLWDGIKQKWEDFKAWWSDHVGGMGKETRKLLGESSPSKVFREIGYYVSEGFALGIQDGWKLVGSAINGMNDVVTDFEPDVVGDIGASDVGNSLEESFSVAIGGVIEDIMANTTNNMVNALQGSMEKAMENVNVVLDKRQFGKMTRKAVADAL